MQTDRLIITEFDESMIQSVHENSLDEDTRRFVPDEVFETVEHAAAVVRFLKGCYRGTAGPFVHPILLQSGENIGYVQAIAKRNHVSQQSDVQAGPVEDGWEIGYHVAKKHTGNDYATEAVRAFLPVIFQRLSIERIVGVCDAENRASRAVMGKCGFVLEYEGTGEYQGDRRVICRYVYLA